MPAAWKRVPIGYNHVTRGRGLWIVSNGLHAHQLERRPIITFSAIGCCLAAAYTLAVTLFSNAEGQIIEGDAVQYYAYLRPSYSTRTSTLSTITNCCTGPTERRTCGWTPQRRPDTLSI